MVFLLQMLQMYSLIIFVRVIMSWMQTSSNNQFSRMIYQVTEPVLEPIRKMIPPVGGGIDLSPVIVIILIQIIIRALH